MARALAENGRPGSESGASAGPDPKAEPGTLRARLASAWERADPSEGGVRAGLDALRAAGRLDPASAGLSEASATLLRDTAAANLSLARLLEGHVNALALLRAHGTPDQAARADAAAKAGTLFGVWAADGAVPVRWDGTRLSGEKRFASGLGQVARAVIAAEADEGQQLVLADAADARRHAPELWQMVGMEATRSGGFDCDGLPAEPVGRPGDYQREPWFVGGTWRIAAVQLGGAAGLLQRAADALRTRGRLEADAQIARLTPPAIRVTAGWSFVLRAARLAEGAAGHGDPDRAAVVSVSARLLTEEIGQEAIAAVERSVGLAMFAADDPVGRTARDLACYMRQVARDAFLQRAGRAVLAGDFAEWLDD